jgi:peptide/nickel transport system permease protein
MTAAAPSLGSLPASRRRHTALRSALRTPSLWIFGLLVLAAVAAPLITSYDPTAVNVGPALASPSSKHWFGTDGYGMDVYTRVVYGARKDLLLALAAASLAAAIGVPLGAVSAYFRGPTDSVLQRFSEMLQSFPVVLLAMAVLIALGASLTNLAIVIAVINVPVYLRISRSVVLPLAQAEFVDAARLTGNGSMSIIGRHLLPNVVGPTMAQFTVTFAWAIQIIAGLSFLGLGVRVPEAEWGLMVQQGSSYIVSGQWWPSFFPGLAIFIAVLTLNRVGAFVHGLTGGPT